MHILKANWPAIIGTQSVDELADGGPLETKRSANIDAFVQICSRKAMIFRRKVGGYFLLRQAKRSKISTRYVRTNIIARIESLAAATASASAIGLPAALAAAFTSTAICVGSSDAVRSSVADNGQFERAQLGPRSASKS